MQQDVTCLHDAPFTTVCSVLKRLQLSSCSNIFCCRFLLQLAFEVKTCHGWHTSQQSSSVVVRVSSLTRYPPALHINECVKLIRCIAQAIQHWKQTLNFLSWCVRKWLISWLSKTSLVCLDQVYVQTLSSQSMLTGLDHEESALLRVRAHVS